MPPGNGFPDRKKALPQISKFPKLRLRQRRKYPKSSRLRNDITVSGNGRPLAKIDIKKNPKPEMLPSRNGVVFLLS